eukprot:4728022-Prymnesium_polylepis.1
MVTAGANGAGTAGPRGWVQRGPRRAAARRFGDEIGGGGDAPTCAVKKRNSQPRAAPRLAGAKAYSWKMPETWDT